MVFAMSLDGLNAFMQPLRLGPGMDSVGHDRPTSEAAMSCLCDRRSQERNGSGVPECFGLGERLSVIPTPKL